MRRKALFFDIDGTLLSDLTGEVPKSAVQALEEAREAGHLTFINTGRTLCSIPAELKVMPFSGLLCGCGTCITYGDEMIFSRHIPHERGRELVRIMEECNAGTILEGEEDCYFPKRMSRFQKIENTRRYFKNMGIGIENYVEDDNYDFDKFVFYLDEHTDKEQLFAKLQEDMELINRQGGFYEVVPKGYSKASAIEYVLEYFGMNKEDAYVFGDSSNDLSMFQYADHAVLMGAHDPVLEPYAEFVTKTVEEDGIAHAMRHYGIIQ